MPNDISESFLKRFKELIERQVVEGKKFVIIVGGGKTSRNYQDAARQFKELTPNDIDWIGINATWLNANLLRIIFDTNAEETVLIDPTQKIEMKKPILIAGGWKPGWSTDYVAVLIAKKLNAHRMINLTNVDFLYNTEEIHTTGVVTPVTDITWSAFRKTIPDTWDPGQHVPFDPVASKEAEKNALEVAIINGQIIEEVEKYLRGEAFRGTKIHS